MDRLSQGEQVSGGAAILLILSLFLKWFGLDLPEGAELAPGVDEATVGGGSGWVSQNTLDIYLLILAGFGLAPAILTLTDGGDIPMVSGAATFLLGVIGSIMTVYVLLDVPDGISRKFGLFIAVIAVIGVTVGGYLTMQDEGAGGDYGDYA